MALVGRVRRAFGLKGELVVQPTTNEPGAVFAPGRRVYASLVEPRQSPAAPRAPRGATDALVDGTRRECIVQSSRPFKDGWLVKLDGVADKTAADRWRGVQFEAPVAELTPPGENEVYEHELVGMRVSEATHGEIGVVAGWYAVPQGLVLEVRGTAWRADVPFNDAFVTMVDRERRAIRLTLPDGLLEPVKAEP